MTEPISVQRSGRIRLAREATGLGIGAAISGIAAYVFVAIGARAVGAGAFAPVSVLWSYWAITVAAITFPLQHWVIRQMRSTGSDAGLRTAVPPILGIVAGLCAVSGVVGFLLREDLFRRDDAVFPVLLTLIPLGAALAGWVRGRLAGAGRFTANAVALAADNVLRVVLAGVAATLGWNATGYGAVLVASFAIVALWPGTFRLAGGTGEPAAVGLLVGIATGSILAQAVLTGAPIALALLDAEPAAVTSMFAALALFRAPYIVGTGVASRLTALFTGLVAHGRVRRLWLVQAGAAALTAGLALAAGAFAWFAGLDALQLLFGEGIDLDRTTIAIVAVGCILAFGTLIQTLVLIGRARWDLIVVPWVLALGAALAFIALAPGSVERRVGWAFLLAESLAYALMTLAEVRTLRGPAPPQDPVVMPGV